MSSTDQLDVSAFGNAQYVKLYLQGTDWAMLSEVQFDGVAAAAAVPEPAGFALALFGLLGMVGFRRRRR